jgi:hypothetical protein
MHRSHRGVEFARTCEFTPGVETDRGKEAKSKMHVVTA